MTSDKNRSGVTRMLGRTRSWHEYPPISLAVHISTICNSLEQCAMISSELASSVSVIQRSVSAFAAALMTRGLTCNGISMRLISTLRFASKTFIESKRFPERSSTCKEAPIGLSTRSTGTSPVRPHPAAKMLVILVAAKV